MTTKYSARHSQKLDENEGKCNFYKNLKKEMPVKRREGSKIVKYIRHSGENSN